MVGVSGGPGVVAFVPHQVFFLYLSCTPGWHGVVLGWVRSPVYGITILSLHIGGITTGWHGIVLGWVRSPVYGIKILSLRIGGLTVES